MKKLILTGKQIRLLLKVENSTIGFYPDVTDFFEENNELPDEETAELEVEEDVFNDVTAMVNGYLDDDSLEEDDKPTESEVVELKELVAQLNLEELAEEKTGENTTRDEEEKATEDVTGRD